MQILTILVIVFGLFWISVELWEIRNEKKKSAQAPTTSEKAEIVNKEDSIHNEVAILEFQYDKEGKIANITASVDTTHTVNASHPNALPTEDNAEYEYRNKWEKAYDVFVQSINPSTSNEIKSDTNKWLIFGLFILISFGLSGLVFTILINMFERRREKWENGDINYNIKKNFFLIIGGHKMVTQLCADLLPPNNPRTSKKTVIVIQTRRKAIMLRKELEAKIGKKLAKSIFIYNGDRTSWDNLQSLNPPYAKDIFIIGEENIFDKNSHDAYSLQCLNLINQMVMQSNVQPKPDNFNLDGRIHCHVMFEYQTSTKIFQYTDRALDPRLDFIPFNYFEKWSAQVLVQGCSPASVSDTDKGKKIQNINTSIEYPSILGPTPKDFIKSDKRVHIIILGMSKMGTMFGAMAAHVCHFPNFITNQSHPRTLITFIDPNGQVEMNYFKGRNPSLCELARWRYVDAQDEKYISKDQILKNESIYQKVFDGVDPMNEKGAKSVYAGQGIDPNLMDIDWEFINGDIGTPSIQKYLQDAANDDGCVTTIAACMPVAYEAVSAAMFLPEDVYVSKNVTQILVLQHSSDAVVQSASQEIDTGFIHKDSGEHLLINPYHKLHPFGMFDQCSYLNHIDLLPMIINLIYNQNLYGEDGNLKSVEDIQGIFDELGKELCEDLDQTKIEKKPVGKIREAIEMFAKLSTTGGKSVQAQRASNIYNSYAMVYKARVFDIQPSNKPLNRLDPDQEHIVDLLAQVEHNRWDTEQIFVGYRPVKETDELLYSKSDPEIKWGTRNKAGKWKDINRAKDLKLRRIHTDIHSYKETPFDKGLNIETKIYDITIAMMTPVLYKIYLELQNWNGTGNTRTATTPNTSSQNVNPQQP